MTSKILTALVGLPILIAFFLYAPLWAFALFIAAFTLLGVDEARALLAQRHLPSQRGVLLLLSALTLLAVTLIAQLPLPEQGSWLSALLAGIVLLASLATLFPAQGGLESAPGRLATSLISSLWITYGMAHFILLHNLGGPESSRGVYFIFFNLAVVWASDAGAFFVGSAIGRHKLSPRISPNKSIEGAVGGLLASVGVAFGMSAWLGLDFQWQELVGLGLILGALGQLGDLVESALKRSAGVKDSGTLFPGHGGVLDRADSLLTTVPVLYWYLVLFPPQG